MSRSGLKQRILAMLLVLVMVISMLPVGVFAAETGTPQLEDFVFSQSMVDYTFDPDTYTYDVTLASTSANYSYLTATFAEGYTVTYTHNNGVDTGELTSGVRNKWINFSTPGTTVLVVTISDGTNSTNYTFNITLPEPEREDDNTLGVDWGGIIVKYGSSYTQTTVYQADANGNATDSTTQSNDHKYYAAVLPEGETSFVVTASANGSYAKVRYSVDGGEWETWGSWSAPSKTAPAKVEIQIISEKEYYSGIEGWDGKTVNSFILWVKTAQAEVVTGPQLEDFQFSQSMVDYTFDPDTYTYDVTLASTSANYSYLTATFAEGYTVTYTHNNGADTGELTSGVRNKWINFSTPGTTVLVVTVSDGTNSTNYTFNITLPEPEREDDNTLGVDWGGIIVKYGTAYTSTTVYQADASGNATESTTQSNDHKNYAAVLPEGETSFVVTASPNGSYAKVRYRVDGGEWETWGSWSAPSKTAPAKVEIQIISEKDYYSGTEGWDGKTVNSFTLWVTTAKAVATADVYVTIADGQGKLAVAQKLVTVSDLDDDGVLTIHEVLYAAHEAYYEGGAAAGYGAEVSSYGLSMTKLWGVENGGSYGYYVNNASAWSLGDAVNSGDYVNAFVYTDLTAWSDTYCYFDVHTASATQGDTVELMLTAAGYDASYNPIAIPVEGATITINGVATEYTTDAEGKVSVKLNTAGQCLISATSATQTLVPPVCWVTVAETPTPQLENFQFSQSMVDYTFVPDTYTYDVTLASASANYSYLTATFAEGYTVTYTHNNGADAGELTSGVRNKWINFSAPGTTVLVVTVSDGTKSSSYTFNITLPEPERENDNTLGVEWGGIVVKYGSSYTGTTVYQADSAGKATDNTTQSNDHKYYAAVLPEGETSFVVTASANGSYAKVRYSMDGGEWETWGSWSAPSKTTPAKVEIQIISEKEYYSGTEGWDGKTVNSFTLWVRTEGVAAPPRLTSATFSNMQPWSFDPEVFTYDLVATQGYTMASVEASSDYIVTTDPSSISFLGLYAGVTTVTVTVADAADETNVTVYTFHITVYENAATALKDLTVTNGTVVHATEQGVVKDGTAITEQQKHYAVIVPTEDDSFTFTAKSVQDSSYLRYSTDGETWSEATKGTLSDTVEIAMNSRLGVQIQISSDSSFSSANTYTLWAIRGNPESDMPWEGSGTEADPFLLRTQEDMVQLRNLTNAGNAFEGMYFRMEADITLPNDWTVIGVSNSKPFSGNLDGNGKLLTVPEGGLPLLGYVLGASVKNLNIYGTKIAGYGLINHYANPNQTGTAIVIDNVTLKSGSSTLKSGLIGSYITTNQYAGASAAYVVEIKNCTIESGVVIGYDKSQSQIGAIAGRVNGTIENCKSYATVYGVDYVGGIVGMKDNALGNLTVSGNTFAGSVVATGTHVGGVAGGIYNDVSAPNGIRMRLIGNSSSGSVTGADKVGGILGGDSIVIQSWDTNSISQITSNISTATVTATGGSYVGGIIGYFHSLNKCDVISGNQYSGTAKGIGGVGYVDTSCATHETASGAVYFNTGAALPGIDDVSKTNHNRTDDPLGADADNLAEKLGSEAATMESLIVSGYKAQYTKGEAFTLAGATATVTWSDGTTTNPSVSEITAEGYDANKLGQQTVTLKYESLACQIQVTVTEEAIKEPTLTGLTVSGNYKTNYVQGQVLDLTGAVYTVTMSDGSKTQLTAEQAEKVTATGYDAEKPGIQTVVLTYETVSATIQVTVVRKTISNLEISGSYKTEYLVGEQLDLAGMVMTAKWNDGSETNVSTKDVTVSGYDAQKQGVQTVTLTYQGMSVTISVTVVNQTGTVTVTFTMLGDSAHGENGSVHTLTGGGLTTWISKKSYTMESTDTVLDLLAKACGENGITYVYSGGYVSSVTKGGTTLADFTNGSNSGWMYTLNGAHPDKAVNEQLLSDGDSIVFHYTDDYTKENGGSDNPEDTAVQKVIEKINAIGTVSYTNACKQKIDAARKAYDALSFADKKKVTNIATLEAAEKAYADLKKADDQEKADAVDVLINKIDTVITLDSERSITAARTAYNKLTADQKALVKNYKKLTDAETALAELKADDEDREKAQEVMDMIDKLGKITVESEEAVKAARAAYDKLTDIQKALVTNYATLEAAEAELERIAQQSKYEDAYITTGEYLAEQELTAGSEWIVIGLIRSGKEVDSSFYESLIDYIAQTIDESGRLHNSKSTENAKMILTLTAMGYDATNVAGYNLVAGLNDMAYIQKQGINGPIFALIALDSGNYASCSDATREALIQTILDAQLLDGGWALSGDDADADITAMALQALAAYYGSNSKVKAAVDKGIDCLSMMQNSDGSFSSGDSATAESVSQVIVALTALGIDPDTDARFIKNGCSAVDALLAFYTDGGFRHLIDGEKNGLATEQGYYALVAYNRFLEGKTSLYNMTDILDKGGDATEPTQPEGGEPTETIPSVTEPATADDDKGGFPWWTLLLALVIVEGIVIAVLVFKSKKRK